MWWRRLNAEMGTKLRYQALARVPPGGPAASLPVVLTILGDIFTLQERAKIQGAFSAVWGSAALAGPALGAFLVNTVGLAPHVPAFFRPYLGWPTIFWINLPLALLAVAVLVFKYEDRHHHHSAADRHSPCQSRRILFRSPRHARDHASLARSFCRACSCRRR